MKFFQSLLSKYILIILIGIVLLPFAFPIISLLFYIPFPFLENLNEKEAINGEVIERDWHEAAKDLDGANRKQIIEKLETFQKEYKESEVFWVNREGVLTYQSQKNLNIPKQWDADYTVRFMKDRVEGDPFTVVAFIGKQQNQGFMVFQISRDILEPPIQKLRDNYGYIFIIGLLVILASFMFVSLLFFRSIRKRLIHLQNAMMIRDESNIPYPVKVKKKDEISQLEGSFNQMIDELKSSRQRELEEEQLRRQLIANLSHDLRTPITAIKAHAYSLTTEPISEKGKDSLKLIDHKISYLDRLIENLMSYTLLVAGKYLYKPNEIEIHRVIKTSIASWYPVFEKEGFGIHVELLDEQVHWYLDAHWFERVLDNLFQNVLRHARSGKFLSIRSFRKDEELRIVIEDKGPGLKHTSEDKGAGIGLAIVALMVKEMGLKWEVSSTEEGTKIELYKIK
ncbi:signal transduction histidine kinase [Bacillus pakistanensis]|uniref:histidine kinase n=1 Tax=Rossellomorea pakistanensis TaxID=992288 RepID=A0ABS2NBG5_9BACI|nr:HAMP domain-containing sensor histidine kinase [Bacillus pakistanensis]MBM7585186.1 signal transduction histidine kinase [Bacillus pakistanensis]